MQKTLENLLCAVDGAYKSTAEKLTAAFADIPTLAQASNEAIYDVIDGNMSIVLYIKLAFALAERRVTDKFKAKKRYKDGEIFALLRALFFSKCNECVYVLCFDEDGKFMGYDSVGEGTVNQSALLPRRIIEAATRRRARSVVIAHNHPRGIPVWSDDDRRATAELQSVLLSAGIRLMHHYVVGCDRCEEIPLS